MNVLLDLLAILALPIFTPQLLCVILYLLVFLKGFSLILLTIFAFILILALLPNLLGTHILRVHRLLDIALPLQIATLSWVDTLMLF